MRRKNQDGLIGPGIVPNARSAAAREVQRQNAGLIEFADFQIAIFRRELDGEPSHGPIRRPLEHDPEKWKPVFRKDHAQIKSQSAIHRGLESACHQCRHAPMKAADLSERILPLGSLGQPLRGFP